jgi:uncharacterized membrane protein YedE/YeeE
VIDRLRATWSRTHGATRIALAVGILVGAVLLGGLLFGVWHVLFGGFVKGNWRAGGFGVVLACTCGVLLAVDVAVVRAILGRAGRARIAAS